MMSDIEDYIEYILLNISSMSRDENLEIMKLLVDVIPNENIKTKGRGSQIKFKDIPDSLIKNIKYYIENKLECKNNELKNLTTIF